MDSKKVIGRIHIENNCGGEMKFLRTEIDYIFKNRPFCSDDDAEIKYVINKCNKCNYEEKEFVSRTSGGFWWADSPNKTP